MVAGPVAAGAAREVGKSAAMSAATGAVRRVTRPFSNRSIKSPKIGGVDVAMILATAGIGVVVSWIGTGRWQRLKRAYTERPAEGGGTVPAQ